MANQSTSEDLISVLEEINKNIKLLVMANRENVEKEISAFLKAGDNKKILNLCNDKRKIKDIAKKVDKTKRLVQYVVADLYKYGFVTLIKAPYGKAKLPKKI
jgi:hypothetical protein